MSVVFLLRNYVSNRTPEKLPVETFSSFKEIPNVPLSWENYLEIEKDLVKLKQKWTADDAKPDVSPNIKLGNNCNDLDLEVVDSQTNQIERISKEEETFKQLMLNNSIKTYEKELSEEIKRQIKEKTSVLNHSFDLLVNNKKKEVAALFVSYEHDLRGNYQNLLSNLQLKLSVADLIDDKDEQNKQKKQLQVEIDQIHQAIAEKLKIKQQELDMELTTFKTAYAHENDTALDKFKIDLETSFGNELTLYKDRLNEEYKTWHLNREKEVISALELRREQKVTATS